VGDIIDKVYLPQALSIGVPYETFWNLSPKRLEPFVEAHKKKFEQSNQLAWINGLYVAHAIGSCFSKSNKYPSKPIDFSKNSNIEELSNAEKFKMVAMQFNRGFKKKSAESTT
jgi:hypothetical protein